MVTIKKQDLRAAFVQLHQKGASASGIARLFGVNRGTVADAVLRFEEYGENRNRAKNALQEEWTRCGYYQE